MHPVRLPVQNIGIFRYSYDFTPCRPGGTPSKTTTLFFTSPWGPGKKQCPLLLVLRNVYGVTSTHTYRDIDMRRRMGLVDEP